LHGGNSEQSSSCFDDCRTPGHKTARELRNMQYFDVRGVR